MKKLANLFLLLILTLSWSIALTYAANDTIKDQWSSASTITSTDNVNNIDVNKLPLTMYWIIEDNWDSVTLKLNVKDLNVKILGWEFSIILPSNLEFDSIIKWENLWEEDIVKGTSDWEKLKINFSTGKILKNNWEMFSINFIKTWKTKLNFEIDSESKNELFTNSDFSFKVENISIDDQVIENSKVPTNDSLLDEVSTIEKVDTNKWDKTLINSKLTNETSEIKTGKKENALILSLLLLIVMSIILIKKNK